MHMYHIFATEYLHKQQWLVVDRYQHYMGSHSHPVSFGCCSCKSLDGFESSNPVSIVIRAWTNNKEAFRCDRRSPFLVMELQCITSRGLAVAHATVYLKNHRQVITLNILMHKPIPPAADFLA